MIKRYQWGDIVICVGAIEKSDRLSRRDREKRAVRSLLSEMGVAPDNLWHDNNGAPKIDGYEISITHSLTRAAVALCPVEKKGVFGIDAEDWRPSLYKVRVKFLSADELEWITEPNELLSAWMIKEAVFKAASLPGMPLTDIKISADFDEAFADGKKYSIIRLDENLTLAVQNII